MEKILLKGKLVALKISALAHGSVPVTDPAGPLQIVTLKHPRGRIVAPHSHPPRRRETEVLQECLVVIRGHIRITFFDADGVTEATTDLTSGQACITLTGAHGVEFLEDSEVIEIKNGPFIHDKEPLAI